MKKRLLALPVLALMLAACSDGSLLPTEKMTIRDQVFTLEVANQPDTRERGLMYRDSMPKNHGMIFIFDAPSHVSFWMKNTRIPLDIIYINDGGSVTGIYTLQPYDERGIHNPPEARFVIELNGGRSQEIGLKTGDKLALPEKILKLAPPVADVK